MKKVIIICIISLLITGCCKTIQTVSEAPNAYTPTAHFTLITGLPSLDNDCFTAKTGTHTLRVHILYHWILCTLTQQTD